MRLGSWCAVATLAAALATTQNSVAWASDPARAEDLIRRANDLRREGKDPAAFPLLQEAYRIARSPRTAAQLGLVELSLSYWLEAERHLSEALETTSNVWIDRNRQALDTALASARNHVGSLDVDGTPTKAEVRVNDAPAGNLPLSAPIKVIEGQVMIEVRAPGHVPQSRTVAVTGRSSQHLSFQLAPTSLPSATDSSTRSSPSDHPVSEPSNWRPALPWIAAGAAAVAAGLAVWQHVRWQHDVGAFEDIGQCGTTEAMRGANARCEPLYNSYTSERTRTFVGYGVAAVFGATAAVLFVGENHSRSEKATAQGLVPGPGTLGLGWRRTF
jgi:hypothetical protein